MSDGPLKPQFAQFLAAAQDSRRSHLGNVFAAMFVRVVRARTKEPSCSQDASEEATTPVQSSVQANGRSIQTNGRMDGESSWGTERSHLLVIVVALPPSRCQPRFMMIAKWCAEHAESPWWLGRPSRRSARGVAASIWTII